MTINKHQLINALELRFDFASARAVFGQALEAIRLDDKPLYTTQEVARICVFLESKRHTRELVQHLLRLTGLSFPEAEALAKKPTSTLAPYTPKHEHHAPQEQQLSLSRHNPIQSPWSLYGLLLTGGALATMMLIFAPWTLLAVTPIILGLVYLMRLQAKQHQTASLTLPHHDNIDELDLLSDVLDHQKALDDFDRRLDEAVQHTSKQTVAVGHQA